MMEALWTTTSKSPKVGFNCVAVGRLPSFCLARCSEYAVACNPPTVSQDVFLLASFSYAHTSFRISVFTSCFFFKGTFKSNLLSLWLHRLFDLTWVPFNEDNWVAVSLLVFACSTMFDSSLRSTTTAIFVWSNQLARVPCSWKRRKGGMCM